MSDHGVIRSWSCVNPINGNGKKINFRYMTFEMSYNDYETETEITLKMKRKRNRNAQNEKLSF